MADRVAEIEAKRGRAELTPSSSSSRPAPKKRAVGAAGEPVPVRATRATGAQPANHSAIILPLPAAHAEERERSVRLRRDRDGERARELGAPDPTLGAARLWLVAPSAYEVELIFMEMQTKVGAKGRVVPIDIFNSKIRRVSDLLAHIPGESPEPDEAERLARVRGVLATYQDPWHSTFIA